MNACAANAFIFLLDFHAHGRGTFTLFGQPYFNFERLARRNESTQLYIRDRPDGPGRAIRRRRNLTGQRIHQLKIGVHEKRPRENRAPRKMIGKEWRFPRDIEFRAQPFALLTGHARSENPGHALEHSRFRALAAQQGKTIAGHLRRFEFFHG